jgi:triacylglycerol lipase
MRAPVTIPRMDWPPLWREARFGLEAAALVRDPILRGDGMADGRGRPVLLVPGFLAGDPSLSLMSNWLRRAGYKPCRAGMLANVDCSAAAIERLERRLERHVERHGRKAVLLGQSRGGCLSKVLAARRPDVVQGLITLGSPQIDPFAVHPLVRLQVRAVAGLGRLGAPGLFSSACLEGECCASFWRDLAEPLPKGIASVSIYSKSDGVVDWRSCLDPHAEQVEVHASHCGMAVNAAAFRAIATALEDMEGVRARAPRRLAAPQRAAA